MVNAAQSGKIVTLGSLLVVFSSIRCGKAIPSIIIWKKTG
jgi:hypothetical protein